MCDFEKKNIENEIETVYRNIQPYQQADEAKYQSLYQDFSFPGLKEVLASIHAVFVDNYEAMNKRLPTDAGGSYFWADNSRALISAIDSTKRLQKVLANTVDAISIDEYCQNVFRKSEEFLQQSGGSQIPPFMGTLKIYYKLPIFHRKNITKADFDTPQIRAVDTRYINDIAKRAFDDIEQRNFDSAITKARTLLEEVFCHAIEKKSQIPDNNGKISSLYKQVRKLYNMHDDQDIDSRIKKLLGGLSTIITSIAEMRNKDSDAHGVGSNRIQIRDYHARLFVNASVTVAEFILSVEENGCRNS